MNNAEARSQLREMLEFQIRQKEEHLMLDPEVPDRKRKLSKTALLKDQRLLNEEQSKMLESMNLRRNV
jgi:hypothetical protein